MAGKQGCHHDAQRHAVRRLLRGRNPITPSGRPRPDGHVAALDDRAAKPDIVEVSERWGRGLAEHPSPIALMWLRFKWRHMKQHGVRAC
ncbi:hypothetical protein GCM10022214_45030 [Actinomadura miaoliensis]|uniref:Transposase n=1 Tax=Actinomadura miaoliensis TaxID=430685 RepID=A0ABP7W5L9_9ACTN